MKNKICFILLILCCFTYILQAQEKSVNDYPKQKKYTFTIQPLQVFNNSLRLDFEMRLKDGPGWLQFGPNFYLKNVNVRIDCPGHYYYLEDEIYLFYDERFIGLREPFSKLTGGGFEINYKRFFEPKRKVYITSGLSYNYFDLKYIESGWILFEEEGLQYQKTTYHFNNQYINRFGVNCFFGFQPQIYKPFVIDFFWGLSFRYSVSNENKPSFDQNMISYGYSGLALLTGFKIGFGRR